MTSRDATRAGINITVTGGWKIFNYFIDTVFLVDMVIAFRTPSVPPPPPRACCCHASTAAALAHLQS